MNVHKKLTVIELMAIEMDLEPGLKLEDKKGKTIRLKILELFGAELDRLGIQDTSSFEDKMKLVDMMIQTGIDAIKMPVNKPVKFAPCDKYGQYKSPYDASRNRW